MNMLFRLFIFNALLLCSFTSVGQKDNGYYGKKAFVQVQTLMNYPLVYNLLYNTGYAQRGNSLVRKNDNFNIGYRVTAGYAVQRNVAFLFEFGQDFSSVYLPDYTSVTVNGTYAYVQHEMIDLKTTVFMPIIEFGSSNALLPMGLSHQIGVGFAITNPIEKDYVFRYYDYDYYSSVNGNYQKYSTSTTDPINFNKVTSVKKAVIMYGLSMRSPITKSLFLNYGIKYTLNIGKYKNFNYQYTTEDELEEEIYRNRTFSFININIGLAFAF